MKEPTLLKKSWNEKDLQRIRNIQEKRFGDSIGIQVGYNSNKINHTEGDIFEEDGKKWQIKKWY
jgi:hypothetical protein